MGVVYVEECVMHGCLVLGHVSEGCGGERVSG